MERQGDGHGEQEVMSRKVAAVMRAAPAVVAVDETVLVAWELLERSGRRHLPVVRPDGRCAGLLDRADLAVTCAAPAVSLSRARVGDLLPGRGPALVHADQTVRHAADIMSYTRADALPVLDGDGQLVGMLTAVDIVAALAGRRVLDEPADAWTQVPPTVLPGLPPRRGYRGTAVP
ncbi:HPP family protein [Streptomyces sp. GC420]|uniref:CBS domain-containing protein n=1 Tax=Streptomyces sp. GC420 TaxID=2697568 RepID=UPI0014151A06|nr:CBS domain-containing protein [Streptomyces sp. GC420]NBM20626.1 CBS domain-containing protein [Streptomyces sp. GC420]